MCQSVSVSAANFSLVIVSYPPHPPPPLPRPSLPSLSPLLTSHRQALSDFCSDPNTFVLNSTQFNTGTGAGTHRPPDKPWLLFTRHGAYDSRWSPQSHVMTARCSFVLLFPRPPFRRAGLLPDLQQAHEQSLPAGNVIFAVTCRASITE